MPGCPCVGEFRAPKDRSLSEYYQFCQDHVTEYNRAWDFFDGMSAAEVEDHIRKSMLWDLETKKFSDFKAEDFMNKAKEFYFGEDGARQESNQQRRYTAPENRNTPEFEALALMGLEPPVDLEIIKKRYKTLAKKYHPDLNKNDKGAEELLKSINMAYTILKLAYEKYGTLENVPA